MAENEDTDVQSSGKQEVERIPAAGESCVEKGEQLASVAVRFSNQDMQLVLYEKCLAIEKPDNDQKGKLVKVKDLYLQWCDVISAQNSSKDDQKQILTVHYIQKQKNRCLRSKSVTVTIIGDNFERVISVVQDQCQKGNIKHKMKIFASGTTKQTNPYSRGKRMSELSLKKTATEAKQRKNMQVTYEKRG